MNINYTESAAKDLAYWQTTNSKVVARIKSLLNSIQDSPFTGLGKPEPLKYELSGCWSRRINKEHRLIYKVDQGELIVLQCRYHY